MYDLVIVESPSKANTINSYLGKNYKVIASKGHVRDLPKSTLGVDTENGFKAKYITIHGKADFIASLKKEAKGADKIFLATDPDREGEAISWHLATVLGIDPEKANRVTFNEITKSTVENEIKNPRAIDMNLVNSQQARRVLDRIVGYKLSPYLWKTIRSGLSAGRVQSVAARIIVEREAEIESFVPREYWTVDAELKTAGNEKLNVRFFGDANGKTELENEADSDKVVSAVSGGSFRITSAARARKAKSPYPPFITSTLQQEASRKLGFQTKRIMRIAQELYEGIDLGAEFGGVHGIITYMRTDSLRVSNEAADWAKDYIVGKYGREYYPPKRRVFKSGATAQDAHEAIRPSSAEFEPELIRKHLTSEQYKLYKLIWDRFIASQMKNAEIDTLSIDAECAGYVFKANEYTVVFDGYKLLYAEEDEAVNEKQNKLTSVAEGDILSCVKLTPKQNYTDPPAHFNEASLIRFLEEKGIGRPSTYAPTITTIIDRGYVEREKKILRSLPLGVTVVELMKKNFPNIVDYKFTAGMEEKLDEIACGNNTLEKVLTDFYTDFAKTLKKADTTLREDKIKLPVEESDIICDKCGRRMIIKTGRYGKFAACPGFPECRNTKPLEKPGKPEAEKEEPEKTDMKCEICGSDIVIRKSRYGKFYACSNFPQCRYTKAIKEEIGVACPKCGSPVVEGHGRRKSVFYSCSRYPECDFSSWDKPTNEKCPECGEMLYEKKNGAKQCKNASCPCSKRGKGAKS